MLVLLSLLALVAGQSGTTGGGTTGPACTANTCAVPSSYCTPGQSPVDPTSACGCPVCKPPPCNATCTAVTTKCASATPARSCNNCSDPACCPSCVPPPCPPCPASNLPVCTGAALTGSATASCATCPSCRPDCSTTNAAAFSACVTSLANAPFCDGTNAGVGCCPLCRPNPPCPLASINTCLTSTTGGLSALSMCVAGQGPMLDFSTCCLNCKPPPPPNGVCLPGLPTAAIVQALRPCIPGEPQIAVPGQCVHTCRLPGSECDPADIGDWSMIQACPAGVPPNVVGCVPTCLPPAPQCTTACSNGQICIRDAVAGATCASPTNCINLHIHGMNPAADATNVLRLIVQKHCEDLTAGVGCGLFALRIFDSLKCTRLGTTVTDPKTGTVYDDIKCCIALDPAGGPSNAAGRRLLAGGDTFQGATQNPGATGNTTFYTPGTGGSAPAASAFLGLTVLLALLL